MKDNNRSSVTFQPEPQPEIRRVRIGKPTDSKPAFQFREALQHRATTPLIVGSHPTNDAHSAIG